MLRIRIDRVSSDGTATLVLVLTLGVPQATISRAVVVEARRWQMKGFVRVRRCEGDVEARLDKSFLDVTQGRS